MSNIRSKEDPNDTHVALSTAQSCWCRHSPSFPSGLFTSAQDRNIYVLEGNFVWAARKGSDRCDLAQKRGALLFSSPLHLALLVSTDHISSEVVWRWEEDTSPKHKRIHIFLFFLLLPPVHPVPALPPCSLPCTACLYGKLLPTSVPDV